MSDASSINQTSLAKRGINLINRAKIERLPANHHLIPKEYKEIAQGMEKQFAQHMIEQMNNTVGGAEKNSAESYYENLLDSERAQKMVTQDKGLGLQDMILDQIYPRHMRNEISFKAYGQNVPQKNSVITMKEKSNE